MLPTRRNLHISKHFVKHFVKHVVTLQGKPELERVFTTNWWVTDSHVVVQTIVQLFDKDLDLHGTPTKVTDGDGPDFIDS